MLSMLQAWNGSVEVNGKLYDDIHAITPTMLTNSAIHIKLLPKYKTSQPEAGDKGSVANIASAIEYRITVKQYMTRKASSDFDFMEKWNNDNPMPLRTMQGTIEKETRGMVYMKLHGVGLQEIHCMRCGKELTHPVSRHYGIGPECIKKVGIFADIEDVASIKEQLVNVTWEGWIIKSAIVEKEAV